MQVGSLVECIFSYGPIHWQNHGVVWLPKMGEILTVREFVKNPTDGVICLRFEENVIGYTLFGDEWSAPIDDFREVQPPLDISSLLEETEPKTLIVVKELQTA